MKRLNADEMIDYMDGTLSSERAAQVEAHLRDNAEDAALVADLKMAYGALADLEAAEPVRAGDDFWIKVRNGLPERAPQRGMMSQVRGWLRPAPMKISLGVAAAVAFFMMMMSVFGPPQSTNPVTAIQDGKQLTPARQIELERSIAEGRFGGSIPQRGVVGPSDEVRNDANRDEEPADRTP